MYDKLDLSSLELPGYVISMGKMCELSIDDKALRDTVSRSLALPKVHAHFRFVLCAIN